MNLCRLNRNTPFPEVHNALREPNGLLAMGGELSVERLLSAYRQGIFPWYSEGEPILWWAPDPRAVFWCESFHASKSMQKFMRHSQWQLRINTAFTRVIVHCATVPRHGQHGTWITPEMIAAYTRLHQRGYAHSIEVFDQNELIGGLYGIAMGRFFFGESMFSLRSNASKFALCRLLPLLHSHGYLLLDSQVPNAHTMAMGAQALPRKQFSQLLSQHIDTPTPEGLWLSRALDNPAHSDSRLAKDPNMKNQP